MRYLSYAVHDRVWTENVFLHLQEADLHSSTGEPWLIPVIIGILVSLVVSLILLVRFCCVRPAAHKKLLKAAELGVPRPDLLHPSLQFDNKVYKKNTVGSAVFRIHDILVWIRIRGSMSLTNGSRFGSGSCSFCH